MNRMKAGKTQLSPFYFVGSLGEEAAARCTSVSTRCCSDIYRLTAVLLYYVYEMKEEDAW